MTRIARYILAAAIATHALFAGAQSSAGELDLAGNIVAEIKTRHAPDGRQEIYDIRAYHDNDGRLTVGGRMSEAGTHAALARAMSEAGL